MTTAMTTPATAPVVSGPRWPLVVAPLVGLIYYLALIGAFSTAIRDVVFSTSDLDQALGATAPKWGTHWIYHLLAEGVSVLFGTFVAGGVARQRGAMAGMIGGLGISLWWAVWLATVFYFHSYGDINFVDPWYQTGIGALAIIAAPVLGYVVGEASREVSTSKPRGFAGIPRAHFLWLWFAAYWYAAGMIGPFLKYYMNGLIDWIPGLLVWALYVIPLVCFIVPLSFGIALLSGASTMRPALRHILGPLVLVVGWGIAAAIQYGIILFVNWL